MDPTVETRVLALDHPMPAITPGALRIRIEYLAQQSHSAHGIAAHEARGDQLELLLRDAASMNPASVIDLARDVLEFVSRAGGLRAGQPPEPVHLRRVEEYILGHAGQAVSIADLTGIARVSSRTLYASFRAHRGCSPMEYLRRHRLQWARSKLLSSPDQAVSFIAFACGFEHLGRFSTRYRERFGESPRQTQQRAKRSLQGSR